MNELTFRQWLLKIPKDAIRTIKELRDGIRGVGVGQAASGVFVAVFPSGFLWRHMTPYWLSPVIFVPLGVFLFVRGLWNCDKEDERDRKEEANR